jgi:hypothetical protein
VTSLFASVYHNTGGKQLKVILVPLNQVVQDLVVLNALMLWINALRKIKYIEVVELRT